MADQSVTQTAASPLDAAQRLQALTKQVFSLSHQAHLMQRAAATSAMAGWPQLVQAREALPPQRARGLRTLWITYDYPAISETYIAAEIRWMQSRGVEAHVYRAAPPSSPGRLQAPTYAGDLAECLEMVKPHIVHVHWLSMLRASRTLFDQANLPVTVRGHSFDHQDASLVQALASPWLRHFYLFPHLAGSIREAFAQRGGAQALVAEKLIPMPSSFDSTRFAPATEKDRKLVVRTGAGRSTKDFGFFFPVAQACPDFRFMLVLTAIQGEEALRAQLAEENRKHGNRVQIVYDMSHEDVSALVGKAGIHLHTFKFAHPPGMPMSIAEGMATGAVTLLRDHPAFRGYGADAALYYTNEASAIAHLRDIAGWSEERWQAWQERATGRAFREYADSWVLDRMLDDWIALASGRQRIVK